MGTRPLAAWRSRVLDRLDGELTALVREAAAFPARARERLPMMLDAYLNLLSRSLKSWRDGRPLETHLDAAESMDVALERGSAKPSNGWGTDLELMRGDP